MTTRIAVIGAGLIGRKHLGILKNDPAFEVAGIADPAPQAEAYARENGFACFRETEALLDATKPDGVVIANPNALHRATALLCIARKIPAIVEKPVADTLADARAIVEAAAKGNVPVLTGYYPRATPRMALLQSLVPILNFFWIPSILREVLHAQDPDRNGNALIAAALIPIVVGYVVAHYWSLLVLIGQQTVIQLSDPLGNGSNWLGTGNRAIDPTLADATLVFDVDLLGLTK